MKAISVIQPWAMLLAVGVKRIETRSWETGYRGPIVIHASKRWTSHEEAILAELRRGGIVTDAMLRTSAFAFGAAIAVADLVGCLATEVLEDQVSERELALGDFGWNRFGWELASPRLLAQAVPVRGALGLWEYTGPVVFGAVA